jgi:hypothetical protein
LVPSGTWFSYLILLIPFVAYNTFKQLDLKSIFKGSNEAYKTAFNNKSKNEVNIESSDLIKTFSVDEKPTLITNLSEFKKK